MTQPVHPSAPGGCGAGGRRWRHPAILVVLGLAGLWLAGAAGLPVPEARAGDRRDKDCMAARADDPVVSGIVLPKLCGPFELDQVRDYESQRPGLGTSLGYQGRPGTASVYVYDKGLAAIPAGIDNDTVRAEFAVAAREVFEVWQAMDAKVRLLESGETGGVGSRLLYARFELRHDSGWRDSYLYMLGARGQFLKVRVTLPQSADGYAVAEAFAQGVAGRVR